MKIDQKDLNTLVNFLSVGDSPQKSDVIFVFGNYKRMGADRAAELFLEGWAPKVLVSGFRHPLLKELLPEEKNEADYFRKILMGYGISAEDILLEEEATNTLENVIFGMKVLKENNINSSRMILCGHPGLLRRARATFQKQFPEIETICVPNKSSQIPEDFWTENRLKRLLGEFDRLNEYYEKGDIAKVEIPDNILEIVKKVKAENNL